MTTATVGTGTITLGAAVSGYLTFANAGIATGDIVSYGIKDGANSEVGTGTYTTSGTTLTRTVTKSTNSNAAISLSGAAEVYITARAEDLVILPTPGGRLTLVTATPVMTSTQSAKTTIFYTPYVGNVLPLYDGTSFTPTAFTELSVATTDTTKSPAAIGASKVNDWFVWNDAGTLRLGHGPDWTSDTARSAGTALVRVNGINLNNAAITNGPAASRGTYVGTTRSNASSQLDWILGGTAAGGTAAFYGVWNNYNRVAVSDSVSDSTASWTYNSTTWRSANNSVGNRVSMVRGLDEDGVKVIFRTTTSTGTGDYIPGIGLDITNGTSALSNDYVSNGTNTEPVGACYHGLPGLGFHFFQATERQVTITAAASVFGVVSSTQITGLHSILQM